VFIDELIQSRVTKADLHRKTQYYIDSFLAKEAITMVFAPPGEGKTYFSMGLANYLVDTHKDKTVVYFDMDNPLKTLNDRGIDELVESKDRFIYQHRSKIKQEPFNILKKLADDASEIGARCYEKYIFFIDSVRDFVDGDMYNDTKVRKMMGYFKDMRDAGATIVLLHHTTKDGRTYQGSQDFKSSLDNSFRLKQVFNNHVYMHFELDIEKERDAVKECAVSVGISDFSFEMIDNKVAKMNDSEKRFVSDVSKMLESGVKNQSEILKEMGRERNDREGIRLLDTFVGELWEYELRGKKKLYKKLVETCATA
jgi:KaiC/GvpD/RAD55 family RecA-like ATPase